MFLRSAGQASLYLGNEVGMQLSADALSGPGPTRCWMATFLHSGSFPRISGCIPGSLISEPRPDHLFKSYNRR